MLSKKTCNQCLIEKELANFGKKTENKKDGFDNKCKICKKEYYQKNKDKFKEVNKQYYEKNKEDVKQLVSSYRKNNKVKIEEYQIKNKKNRQVYSKQHYEKNKDHIREYHTKWNNENKEWYREWEKNQRINNPHFKIKKALRCRIWFALNSQNANKQNKTKELLGCSIEEYKQHLESQFKPEMNWKNYGTVWEIDHIISISSFDLTNIEEQLKCFNFTNTQPLFKTTAIAESFGYINEIGNREKFNK